VDLAGDHCPNLWLLATLYLDEIVAVCDVRCLQGADPAGHNAPNLEPESIAALDALQTGVEGRVQWGQLVQLAKN
jgi:hypothetical protein